MIKIFLKLIIILLGYLINLERKKDKKVKKVKDMQMNEIFGDILNTKK